VAAAVRCNHPACDLEAATAAALLARATTLGDISPIGLLSEAAGRLKIGLWRLGRVHDGLWLELLGRHKFGPLFTRGWRLLAENCGNLAAAAAAAAV